MSSSRRGITRLAPLAVIGLCAALAGCSRAPHAGGSNGSRAVKARNDAEQLAVNAAVAGATARAKALPDGGKEIAARGSARGKSPALKTAPRAGSPAVIRERVASSLPYPTEAEAEEDAIAQAQLVVSQKLAELDPPLSHVPSPAEVKADYLRKESRTVSLPDPAVRDEVKDVFAQSGLKGNPVYVEYDVEVSADQVRELRAQERVIASLRIVGMALAGALAAFLFLRADEWTRGYLTRWLALAAVMLAGGTAAALIFI